MQNYRKTSHSVYDIKYHLVWITKYRKPILSGTVATRLRELIRVICRTIDIEIKFRINFDGPVKSQAASLQICGYLPDEVGQTALKFTTAA